VARSSTTSGSFLFKWSTAIDDWQVTGRLIRILIMREFVGWETNPQKSSPQPSQLIIQQKYERSSDAMLRETRIQVGNNVEYTRC
jgi:hypothetical protein